MALTKSEASTSLALMAEGIQSAPFLDPNVLQRPNRPRQAALNEALVELIEKLEAHPRYKTSPTLKFTRDFVFQTGKNNTPLSPLPSAAPTTSTASTTPATTSTPTSTSTPAPNQEEDNNNPEMAWPNTVGRCLYTMLFMSELPPTVLSTACCPEGEVEEDIDFSEGCREGQGGATILETAKMVCAICKMDNGMITGMGESHGGRAWGEME